MERTWVFKALYPNQSLAHPWSWSLTWISASTPYPVSPLKVCCPDSSRLFCEWLSRTTMSLLYRKAYNGAPLLLGYKPTTHAAHKAFHAWPYLEPQASPPSHMVLAHLQAFNVPPGWNTLSVWPGLQDSTWSSTFPGKHPFPQWGLGAPHGSSREHTYLNTHRKETQYPFTGLSPLFQDPGWQGWSFVFESSLIINHA